MCCHHVDTFGNARIIDCMEPGDIVQPVRAVDALRWAVHVAPSLYRESRAFGGISVCAWNTPWLESFALPETDDLTFAYHRGGSNDVRVLRGDEWSRVRSTPGLLTLIPPGRRVAYHTRGAVSFATVHVSRAALLEFVPAGAGSFEDRFAFRDPFVASCMDALLREARASNHWTPRFVSAVTEALLLHLLYNSPSLSKSQTSSPKTPAERIEDVRLRIDVKLAGDLTVDELAAEAGLSRAHFIRTFQRIVGESPHRYVMSRRVEFAKRLLNDTSLSLKAIAHEAGFCSQSHFTHIFRTQLGLTPQQFRRKN